jgi:cytochrome b561
MKQTYPTLDILLRWVVALAVFVYFGAAERPLGAGRSVRAVAQTHQKQDSSSNC